MISMASSYSIIYAPSAGRDLEEIREYITREFYDSETANRQVNRIVKAVNTIAFFPKMYRIRRKDTGMRICPVDNYLITYYVDDERHVINISHIIYGRRDINSVI